MQSFKYAFTEEKPRRRRRARTWRALIVASLIGATAYGAWPHVTRVMSESGRLVAWMIGDPAQADERAQEAESSLRQGDTHLQRGEYRTALKCYGDAMRQHPENLKGWDRVRLAAYLLGDAAPPRLEELLPKPAIRARHWLALGLREREAGRFDAAQAHLERATALAPEDAAAQMKLAEVIADKGQLDQAIALAEQATHMAPDSLEALGLWFALRLRQGDTEQACADAIAALQAHLPSERGPHALALMAEAHLHQGLSVSDVRVQLAKAAPQMGPSVRQLSLMQAYVRHYQSNPNWHRDSFLRVKELAAQIRQPGTHASDNERHVATQLLLEAHQARAKRFFDRSDLAASRLEIEHAIALANSLPRNPQRLADLHAERGRLLLLDNRTKEATQAFEAATKLVPTHSSRIELARMQAGMGMMLLSEGHKDAARDHFRRALQLNPGDDRLLARYFQSLQADAPLPAALKCARVVKEPDVAHLLTRLLHGLAEAGKPGEARSILRLASSYKLGPGHLAELRGQAAIAAEQFEPAREALLQAVEHRPEERIWLRLADVEMHLADSQAKSPVKRVRHLMAAHEASRRALTLAPDGEALKRTSEVALNLAQSQLALRDAKSAEAVAERAVLLSPGNPDLALVLADARRVLGRSEGVVDACREGLAGITNLSAPQHAGLRWRLGRELRQLGRHTEALDVLSAGLTEAIAAPKPLATQIWYELAFVHAALEQREEAMNALRQYTVLATFDPEKQARSQGLSALAGKLANAR